MINLDLIQDEQKEWSQKNFGDQKPYQMILGVTEELGELCHANLKLEQGIRTNENHEAEAKDAVGDMIIYLLGYCNLKGYDIEDIISETWDQVRMRDWKNNPEKG